MDVVTLPLVWPQLPIGEALGQMERRRCAGLVRFDDGDDSYRLFYIGAVLQARADQLATVGQIPDGHRVLLPGSQEAAAFGLDLVRPLRTSFAYEALLDARELQYALASASANTAMIATRHEGQTATLRSTGGYACSGPRTHYFPEPRVDVGGPCPLCSGSIYPA